LVFGFLFESQLLFDINQVELISYNLPLRMG